MTQLRALRESGLSEEQAEAIVTVVESREGEMVSREYLRGELGREIGNLKAEIIKWMFLFILGQSTVFLGALYFLYNALRP